MWPGGGSRPSAEDAKKGRNPNLNQGQLGIQGHFRREHSLRFGIGNLSAPGTKSEIHVDLWHATLSFDVFWQIFPETITAEQLELVVPRHIAPRSALLSQEGSSVSRWSAPERPEASDASYQGVLDARILVYGSLYRAFGLSGGFLAGDDVLIQELRFRSRGYMFSTSPQPFVMDMARKALEMRVNWD